jgi:hypothetical protein
MDLIYFLITAAVFSALSLARWRWWAQPAKAASSAHSFARKVDLGLADHTAEVVTARMVRRERAAIVTGGLGALGAAALAALTTEEAAGGFRLLAVVLGLFVGHAVGHGVVAWRESVSRAADGPRLARATVPTHGDYVARHERVGAWVVAGLAFLGGAALLLLGGSEVLDGAFRGIVPTGFAVAVMGVPALTVVLDELLARRLLDRPQVAATTLELAWDDALRSRTLRDMITVPLTTGYFGLTALLGVVGDRVEGGWPDDPAVGIMAGAFIVLLLGGAVMAVVSLVLGPERHVRRRLWPTPPGAPVVSRPPLPTWGSAR